MENRLKIGDKRVFTHTVQESDIAAFDSGKVHPVCSTFALAKYIEWTGRLFVLDIKEDDEEGIGTMLHIDHKAPAFKGYEIHFEAIVEKVEGNELICGVTVTSGKRVIALAKTSQKILKKSRINDIFSSLEKDGKE
jgi:predicted thioesterase